MNSSIFRLTKKVSNLISRIGHRSSSNAPSIPIIDFSNGKSKDLSQKSKVADDVFKAVTDVGFMVLLNHGINQDLVSRVFLQHSNFFALPVEVKRKYAYTTPAANRGWLGFGQEKLNNGKADLKETFEIGNEQEKEYPNHWPTELPGFKTDLLDYFKAMDKLHLEVLSTVAIGLKLPEYYFHPLCNENHQNLRLLSYPACKRSEIEDAFDGKKRAGEHTDYGTVTLLVQSNVGGLQVKTRAGVWVDAPVMKNAVIVNIGDALMRWSNDILISNPHRVVQDPSFKNEIQPARSSIAFFCNPNKSALLTCLPGCSSESRPPRYTPITAFDYLTGRLADTI